MSIDISRPPSSCAGEDCNSLLGDNSDVAPSRNDNMSRYRHQRSSMPLSDENDDTDDQAQMDLALNSNFDLGLFDYNWSDEPNHNPSNGTSTDVGDSCTRNCEEDLMCSSSADVNNLISRTILHPQAIPSSANCPPIESSTISLNSSLDGPNRERPNTCENDKSCSEQLSTTIDWTANITATQPNFNPAASVTNNLPDNTHYLSSQIQELLARQSVTSMLNTTTNTPSVMGAQPPFLLFDAPIELRANFIASQRAHGFPILEDNNSFHYHHQPQVAQQTMVAHLVDGRHCGMRNKRVKNEREQKRTQKITDLIDQLRDKMEEGGWKVGGTKSKYATLSTCAAYVKHLVKANREQEIALEKTKQDLEARRRKLEDDKEYQQDPSDPESTISSLTVSSSSAQPQPTSNFSGDNSNKKRCHISHCNTQQPKKLRNHIETKSNKVGSCIDIGNSSSGSNMHGSNVQDDVSNSSCSRFTGGASTVGAVAQGVNSRTRRVKHPDVIFKEHKKRPKAAEATSMDSSFTLDYEEVFIKSSVPQLLATTAGRIVSWNDIFLKASGLLPSDMESLTIFSLVKQTELVNLFEIVAAALRSGSMVSDGLHNGQEISESATHHDKNTNVTTSPLTNFSAITLPCTTFRSRRVSNSQGKVEVLEKLLYMTVTLMTDLDPKKRCFHCVFSDSPGTHGAVGSVTPELLSVLFTSQNDSNYTGSV